MCKYLSEEYIKYTPTVILERSGGNWEPKMAGKTLKHKPLREAIFELRWKLEEPKPGFKIDSHYKLLIGRLYDKVKKNYPFHEQLPTSTIPDAMAAYIVQHRFRKKEKGWPLIQIGPGILTLNDTEGYVWKDFEKKINEVLSALFDSYSDAKKSLEIDDLTLRYIDAIDFDYEKTDAFKFLKEKMKINIGVYEKLFEGTGIESKPLGFQFIMIFPSKDPAGAMHLRFTRGQTNGSSALIWETVFQSKGEDAPDGEKEIMAWMKKGHNLTDDWFFKIIEGDLQKRFE